MNEIKEYKELTTISTFDWDILAEASVDLLEKMLNADWNFIRIWDEIIAKNQIKKIFKRKIDTIENFILQFPKEIQQKLRERDQEKFNKVWRHFESIQEIQNYIGKDNIDEKINNCLQYFKTSKFEIDTFILNHNPTNI